MQVNYFSSNSNNFCLATVLTAVAALFKLHRHGRLLRGCFVCISEEHSEIHTHL